MSVRIRERKLLSGDVAFYLDVYHRDYKRFSQKTGLQVNPKNRKAYSQAKADANTKAGRIEMELLRDPASVFRRKPEASDNFTEYFRSIAAGDAYPASLNALKHLNDFSGGMVSFGTLNAAWLERFREYLLSLGSVGHNTARGYFGIVKTMLRRAYREGLITADFTGEISGIGKKEVEQHFLTIEDIDALNQARCDHEMIKKAFLFACFSGLRLSDIERLQWDRVSLIDATPLIRLQQKENGRDEILPLPDRAVRILQEARAISPGSDGRVFTLPLSRSRIGAVLHSWGERAGLPWRLHFSASRNARAAIMLNGGADLVTVAKLPGCRDLKTVIKYALAVDAKRSADSGRSPAIVLNPPRVPLLVPEKIGISDALEAKGRKVAKALGMKKNEQGLYDYGGQKYCAADLALEAAGSDE